MLAAFSIMMKVVFFPIWFLWRLYLVMWWAFDNRPTAAAAPIPAPAIPTPGLNPGPNTGTAPAGQDSAFQVTNSTRKNKPKWTELSGPPVPRGTLKGGFVGAMVASAASGILSTALTAENQIHAGAGVVLWSWLTAMAMFGSLLVVRRIVTRAQTKREARRQVFVNAAKNVSGAVGGAVGAMGGAVGGAVGAAAANVASAFAAARKEEAKAESPATSPTAQAESFRPRTFARNAACAAGRGACRAWTFARANAPIAGSKLVATLKRMGDPVKAATPQTSA